MAYKYTQGWTTKWIISLLSDQINEKVNLANAIGNLNSEVHSYYNKRRILFEMVSSLYYIPHFLLLLPLPNESGRFIIPFRLYRVFAYIWWFVAVIAVLEVAHFSIFLHYLFRNRPLADQVAFAIYVSTYHFQRAVWHFSFLRIGPKLKLLLERLNGKVCIKSRNYQYFTAVYSFVTLVILIANNINTAEGYRTALNSEEFKSANWQPLSWFASKVGVEFCVRFIQVCGMWGELAFLAFLFFLVQINSLLIKDMEKFGLGLNQKGGGETTSTVSVLKRKFHLIDEFKRLTNSMLTLTVCLSILMLIVIVPLKLQF